MLAKVQTLFNLRYEDRRKVWIMGSVFFLAGISEMMNYTSFMAMFNSRVGTQYLPMMYLVEAFLLPLEGWALSYLSQRLTKPRFMVTLYLLFLSIVLINGFVLLTYRMFELSWLGFYIILFLGSNFVIRQQTLLMWATAFDLCPTQQAKRLMPIFVLAAIFGGIIAGVLSNLLAPLIGPELLYLLAAGFLLAGLPNFLRSLKQYLIPLTFKLGEETEEAGGQSSSYYLKKALRSPFLLTVIGIMTLMPAVYFLMEYQYFTSAQAVFKTEAELTAFYGLMVIILFCAAFLLQLFAAKLIDWLGASNTILAISLVFLGCFALVSVFIDSDSALLVVSFGYCLTYLLLYYFAEPSYQFFFKMFPIKHRDGYRYTVQGIAASAGILLGSGVSMLHSGAGMSLTWQAIIGTIMTGILFILSWADRHLYIKELVKYIQISSASVKDFMSEFLESMKHDRVRRTLIEQLSHSDETVQLLTLELFAGNPDPQATEPLLRYAEQHSGWLRAHALEAIPLISWRTIPAERLEPFLQDVDAAVRVIAFRRLLSAGRPEADTAHWLSTARADASMEVRAEALGVMEESEALETELRQWIGARDAGSVLACQIVGERKLKALYMDVMMCLLEPIPVLRNAAVRALGCIGDLETATSLGELLIGADLELRAALEQALIDIGSAGMPELTRFMSSYNDEVWRAAVTAMNAIASDKEIHDIIVPSCVNKLRELSANKAYVASIEAMGQEQWSELARMRSEELTKLLLNTIWTVMIRFGDERAIPQLRMALEGDEEEVRDNGLEILSEGLGNVKLSAALFDFYQNKDQESHVLHRSVELDQQAVEQSQEVVTDPWLQAIAIKAGAAEGASVLVNNWVYLSALDKIVLLKQVPLFHDISIEELGRIASIAGERVYEEGEFLMKQDELTESMFVVIEGHVEISGRNENGTVGTIGVLGAMQSIGEAGLFDERPSHISAQAIFDSARVLEIESKEAARLVRLYPDIGVGLLRAIGTRLRAMEHMVLKMG